MESILDQTGETVTLTVHETSDVNKWGDSVNESTTQKEVDVVVRDVTDEASEDVEGDVRAGEKKFYLDGGETDISEGNVITLNGQDYRIDEVEKKSLQGESHYEVSALVI